MNFHVPEAMSDPILDLIAECRAQAEKCRTFVPSRHIGPLWGVGYVDACKSMASWLDGFADELDAVVRGSGATPPREPQKAPKDCVHEDFAARVNVMRMEDSGNIIAEVTVACTQCGEPFRFLGVPAGLAWDRPTVDITGLTLNAPIEPQGEVKLHTSARYEAPNVPTKN